MERVISPDRLLYPMARTPGTDSFKRISWEEALQQTAEKLAHFKERFGPQSIFYYAGSGTKGLLNSVGMSFWKLFGGCTTTYGDLCWPAGLEATRLTLGENKHNAPWDLANAKLIVLWGKNPAETNIHQMPFIDQALERGARLIVIDPRRTESSERAELLIQPRPGSDGALALGVAHLLVKHGRIDLDFIARHVHGFAEFSRMAEDFTPERAAALSDVPVRCIERLADYLGSIKPATICAGFGMQRYTNSGQTMRAMIALLAITGNIGTPGAGWQFANLQSAIFDRVRDPLAFYPPEQEHDGVRVSVSTARLGPDMLAPSAPELKMAWIERGNPVTQNPQTNAVRQAFDALEFCVVVDQFLTDTARMADLVLPAKTLFEQSDVIGAYWHSYLQLKQKVLEPPGEVKPESEIYRLLALRLGLPAGSRCGADPGADGCGSRRLARAQTGSVSRADAGAPSARPRAGAGMPGDCVFRLCLSNTLAEESSFIPWKRRIAGALIRSRSTANRRNQAAANHSAASTYPLTFLTPNTKDRIHSQFGNLKMIRRRERTVIRTHQPRRRRDTRHPGRRSGAHLQRSRRSSGQRPASISASGRAACP